MKYQIIMDMFFTLLARKRVSAAELAARYGVSVRSIYRYVEELTVSGVPVDIAHGRYGGVYISDAYKLPVNFLNKAEYRAALDAMQAMRGQIEDAALDSAIEKISSQYKKTDAELPVRGDVIVDSSAWGDHRFRDKIELLQRAVREKECLEIDYVARTGEETRRTVEPHVLVYKQNVWYIYAWCRKRAAFRLFKVGRIRMAVRTGQTFEKRDFSPEDIPLRFDREDGEPVEVELEISPAALPDVEEWLGVDCIRRTKDGKLSAVVALPDDEGLIRKLLGLGAGVRVLAPERVKAAVKAAAEKMISLYG